DYYLLKWHPSREIVLQSRRQPYDKYKPKGIVYRVIPEDLTAIVEFEVGNIDVLGIPASAFSHLVSKKDKNIITVRSLNTYYLGMNTQRYPFNNKNIRKAVAHAIDREKILNTFMQKRGRLADCIVPEELRQWRCSSDIRYDPNEARRMLNLSGIDSITVTMFVTPEQDVIDLAEIIQYYLDGVGIKVRIKQIEWTAFKEAVIKGDADLFWLSWWVDYPHPENFLYPLFHSRNIGYGGNKTRFVDREIDDLLDISRLYIKNHDVIKAFKTIEDKIMSELPMIPFWHKTDYILVQPWVKGVKGYPIYNMDRADSILLLR
ncbi:MAG: ABC transporter substrate-binding protein, partial [Thermodesulfovibrionales bacterium]